jgi:hypothetical protein
MTTPPPAGPQPDTAHSVRSRAVLPMLLATVALTVAAVGQATAPVHPSDPPAVVCGSAPPGPAEGDTAATLRDR